MKNICIVLVSIAAALGTFLCNAAHTDAASEIAISSPNAVSDEGIVVAERMPAVIPYELNEDVRNLQYYHPNGPVAKKPYHPLLRPPLVTKYPSRQHYAPELPPAPVLLAPMPALALSFAGMSFLSSCTGGQCGSGYPPDPNGAIGPNNYIEAVNTAYAIYDKSGVLQASFTEDNLFIGTPTANQCNGNSQGDPIVVYDPMADRWILSHFASATDNSGNLITPFYQCIAVSKSGDPVSGGWWLYTIRMDPGGTGLPPVGTQVDYSKFGIWPNCLYMSANEFTAPGGAFAGTVAVAFSRSALESGSPISPIMIFLETNNPNPDYNIFTMIPSNVLGASPSSLPPDGTPNYFVSVTQTAAYGFEVRKFAMSADCTVGSFDPAPILVSIPSYDYTFGVVVPQPLTAQLLDAIDDRLMQKVQYRKINGAESLWVVHNIRVTPSSPVSPDWAQIDVTGGTIATTPVQRQTYTPDTTLYRWMGSLAVDKDGNMALGYSTSSSTNYPSIAYSGWLSNGTLQSETQLIAGAGSQIGADRWGDYSSMSVDPSDDCTFWYTNEYYANQSDGNNIYWSTRIGAFRFSTCNPGELIQKVSNSSFYSGVTTAYSSVTGTDVLNLQAITFYESPVMNNGSSVTLQGGYNSSFSANPGFSAIHGTLTIGGTGQITVDKVSIQ